MTYFVSSETHSVNQCISKHVFCQVDVQVFDGPLELLYMSSAVCVSVV